MKTTTSITRRIALPPTEFEAEYEIRRIGQQPPSDGDDVIVEAIVRLPAPLKAAYSDDSRLPKEIRFTHRVTVCGYCLHGDWGEKSSVEGWRYRRFEASASHWDKAFAQAEERAEAQIAKLADALKAREQALIDAEEPSMESDGEEEK